MKKSRALIALVLVFTLILSTGSVFAASTDLTGGYFGYKLNKGTTAYVSDDGILSVTQNADQVYNYPNTEANIFSNSSFENSTDVVSAARLDAWTEINSGWASSNEVRNTRLNITIVDDAHSGNNAFRIERILNDTNTTAITVSFYNLDTVKNTLDASDTNKTIRDGAITGLESGKDYIFSFWVKGNAETRFQYREDVANGSAYTYTTAENYKDSAKQDLWELVSIKLTADSVGVWANIYCLMTNVAGTYAVIDDIQFMTVSDAEAMVKQMIADLDVTSPTAARAIDDIEQWCTALSLTGTDEYAAFQIKKAEYDVYVKSVYELEYANNILENSGFELLNTEISGWDTSNSNHTASIVTEDVHSGDNALKLEYSTGSSETQLCNTNTTKTALQVENSEYILSAWVKGNSPRFFYRPTISAEYDSSTETVSATLSSTKRCTHAYTDVYSDWTLLTYSFNSIPVTVTTDESTSATLTTYWLATALTVNFGGSGKYTLLDDIALMKKSDAIANVEAMIANLDTKSQNAARAIDDIEQWVAVLGSANISNYDLFSMKKSGYVYYSEDNALINASFEKSDAITAVSGTGFAKELTTGWTTAWGSDAAIYSITDDAHSGKNAISVEAIAGTTTRLFNTNNIKYNLDDENYRNGIMEGLSANTEYIISYWVKGSGQTKAWGKNVDTNGYDVGYDQNSEYIVDPGDTWKLNTLKLTTNEKGEFWFNIFTSNIGDANITAIIDDVQVLTVDETIAHVDALIDAFAKLDSTDANYARANDDIKQWVNVLHDPDLTVKYDIALNQKYNIITPNDGYTHLAEGDYIASVSLKGKGTANRVYGDNITNIESVATTLTSDFVTYSKRVTVGAYGTHYMGVQLEDTTDVNTVEIKDFSLKRVGDVNESGEIDIRDMVRMARGLMGTDDTVDALVADYDNSESFDSADIAAIREKIMNTDKLASVLRGKTVSVLGDSISTFKGYNKNAYSNTTIYKNNDNYYNSEKWDYMTVNDTYWKQIIDITETRLLVDNAYAGASLRMQGGASRGVQLHDDFGYYEGDTPDIILVHYGTNDYLSDELPQFTVEAFATDYDEMVAAMCDRYPNADIYLFTLPPYDHGGTNGVLKERHDKFNNIIRDVAEKYECPLVDLYNDSEFTLDTFESLTFDGLHPNKAGMDAITDAIYNVMCEQYIN